MDTKSLLFCAIDTPSLSTSESGFAFALAENVWRNGEGVDTIEGRANLNRAKSRAAMQDPAQLSMASEVAHDVVTDALWINESGQILDCSGLIEDLFGYWKDELTGQHISVLLPDLTHASFLQYSSPSTIWLDDQGQIVECAGPIEEMFGYWTGDLKGQHVSMLVPDLAHTDMQELTDDGGLPIALKTKGVAASVGMQPEGDENACAVLLKFVLAKAGRELSVLMRSQVH